MECELPPKVALAVALPSGRAGGLRRTTGECLMLRYISGDDAYLSPPSRVGDWGDLGWLLTRSLAPGALVDRLFWLPDIQDPSRARHALGVIYVEGSAMPIAGLYAPAGPSWQLRVRVSGLLGYHPRNARFGTGATHLVTTVRGRATGWTIANADGRARQD